MWFIIRKIDFMKTYVYILFINFLKDLQWVTSQSFNQLNNTYGDDYGIKWIYFPDGDGESHYVNLDISEDDYIPLTRGLMDNVIEYRLHYTRNGTVMCVLLDETAKPIDDSIDLQKLLSDMPLKIITHGWMSSLNSSSVSSLKDAYLEAREVNVITADWSGIAGSLFYHLVARETKKVGARLASFLDALHNQHKISGDQVHLIGHSLGAHVAGIAASRAKFSISRVTGLDPARPLFEYPFQDNSAKLDSSDAEFVDVIHTCSGTLGCIAPLGTVDFYPNNGFAPQPGCDSFQKIFETFSCSHGRSFNYFEESIRSPRAFPAFQCQTWKQFIGNRCNHYTYMGDSVSRNVSGKFYLTTNVFKPFGLRT